MLAWWRKKSNSNWKKEEQKASITGKKAKSKAKSFDEIIMLGSAKNTCSGIRSFSGSESDRMLERRGHPLPRPSVFPASSSAQDQRAVSCSTSSINSSGSSDDPMDVGFVGVVGRYSEPTKASKGKISELNSQILQHIAEDEHIVSRSPFPEHSKLQTMPTSARNELWAHGSTTPNGSTFCSPRTSIDINFTLISRSLCPGLSGHTRPASPSHPWACGLSPESSSEKQEDGKNRLHPLPLPPGSDSHPSRNNSANNTAQSLSSIWKKGKLLGRGTFGHVYVGFNSENGQMCAIKEVRVISDDQNSKECLGQLNQEISLLSQLSHPNIVKYHGSELAEDVLSVYLEYVSGGSIHKLLQEYGPFKEPVIQNYTRQILSGLAYLHDRNTLHRDVKGANILVDPNGEIKLADFGMAKHISSYTSALSFKGSPYWMAPEVIMNCNGYSMAVDIWSLGCTILEMATAKPPWIQYEGVAAMFKIMSSEDIPEIPDHISNDGKSFLKLCLQRDPSARPTAAQLMEHPFVRDQPAAKNAKINIKKDASQDSFHIPKSRDFRRSNFPVCDGDYGMKCVDESPVAFRGLSDQASKQVNFSLPFSPCSSPLQFVEPVCKSCSLSPVYMTGIGHHGLVHRSVYPPRNDANLEIRMKSALS